MSTPPAEPSATCKHFKQEPSEVAGAPPIWVGPSMHSCPWCEIDRLRNLAVRLVDELVTVEYDGDPPKRVLDMIEEAEELR